MFYTHTVVWDRHYTGTPVPFDGKYDYNDSIRAVTQRGSCMGRSALVNVSLDTYEDALDRDIPIDTQDSVVVDHRGYSDRVAEELGADYLDGRSLVFHDEQIDGFSPDSVLFPDPLMYRIAEKERFRDMVDRYGPVALTYDLDLSEDITMTADYDLSCSSSAFETATEIHEELSDLDADALNDVEYTESLVQTVQDGVGPVNLEETMFSEPVASVSTDRLILSGGDHTTYLFTTDANDLYAVAVGTDDNPLRDWVNGYWTENTLTAAMESLYESGDVSPVGWKANTLKETIADATLDRVLDICDVRDSRRYGSAMTLDNLLNITLEETVPDAYHALDELEAADDVSMDTDAELIKVAAIDGQTPFFSQMMSSLRDAYTEDASITAWRHGMYEYDENDLKQAYREWSYSHYAHTAEKYVPDGRYSADAITRFCENTALSDDDGAFLTALINDMADDEIVLESMSQVNQIGREMTGKTVIVDGDVGDWIGYEMRDGVLEIKGNAGKYVGTMSQDGEIYLHGEGEVYEADADVYKKQRFRSLVTGRDMWTKVS